MLASRSAFRRADERSVIRRMWRITCSGPGAWLACLLLFIFASAWAAPSFSPVIPGQALLFPRDFGAHPNFRNEWWYITGWLQTPDKQALGFQLTFFRVATGEGADNPSRFAPRQLILAHAALSDPALGRLRHDQKIAREGFGLADAEQDNTDLKLDDWRLVRYADGHYQARITAREFTLELSLKTTQPLLLQGDQGFSRKGPKPEQASYYYSEPQLQVDGKLTRGGKEIAVSGSAWLDHEWSTTLLDPEAAGWDWIGANLDDGSALMAFRIRGKNGATLWSHAVLRDKSGRLTRFAPEQVHFVPRRTWRSPRTNASYPVALQIETGGMAWEVVPLLDDQELDSRQSTGAVYWEGAVMLMHKGQIVGRGYLEMTGYVSPLKL